MSVPTLIYFFLIYILGLDLDVAFGLGVAFVVHCDFVWGQFEFFCFDSDYDVDLGFDLGVDFS